MPKMTAALFSNMCTGPGELCEYFKVPENESKTIHMLCYPKWDNRNLGNELQQLFLKLFLGHGLFL